MNKQRQVIKEGNSRWIHLIDIVLLIGIQGSRRNFRVCFGGESCRSRVAELQGTRPSPGNGRFFRFGVVRGVLLRACVVPYNAILVHGVGIRRYGMGHS